MQAAAPDEHHSSRTNNRHMVATNVDMATFAKYLSRNQDVGKMVVDETGLTGGFDFELDWAPDLPQQPSVSDRPSIFTALQERLGLKLESAKIPAPALVVDRAEKPEGN
jgi:uncharacterized protein (TIGR03435 family)